MIGGFGVAFGTNSTGLLVRIADGFDRRFTGEGVIQVHCTSTRHQEDVLHPLRRHKADYIVGKFHQSNLKWDSGRLLHAESFIPW
jgi:hypothetical protein